MITMLKKDMSDKDETRLESDIIREKMLKDALEKNTKLNKSNTKLSESNTKLTEEKEQLCNITNQLLSDLEDSPHNDIKKLLDYYKPLYNRILQRT